MEEVKRHLGKNFQKTNRDRQSELAGEDKNEHRSRYRCPGPPGKSFENGAFFGFVLHKISGAWREAGSAENLL